MSDDQDHGSPPPGPTPPWSPPPAAAGSRGWPARFGVQSAVVGFIAAQLLIGVFLLVYMAFGGSEKDPFFIAVATVLQGVGLVGVSVLVARRAGPVRAVDFGLARAPFWSSLGKVVTVAIVYFALLAVYASAVNLDSDDSPTKLGADKGATGMLVFVLVAVVVAPLVEELFFRGMVFRAFANGMGVMVAAVASGLMFGALHVDSVEQERLLQVVPLAFLGVLFALLYHWSRTLFAPIALHATNNTLAVVYYATDKHSEFGVAAAIVCWLALMLLCTAGWRLTDRAARRR